MEFLFWKATHRMFTAKIARDKAQVDNDFIFFKNLFNDLNCLVGVLVWNAVMSLLHSLSILSYSIRMHAHTHAHTHTHIVYLENYFSHINVDKDGDFLLRMLWSSSVFSERVKIWLWLRWRWGSKRDGGGEFLGGLMAAGCKPSSLCEKEDNVWNTGHDNDIIICMIFVLLLMLEFGAFITQLNTSVCVYFVHKHIPSATEGKELVTPINPWLVHVNKSCTLS